MCQPSIAIKAITDPTGKGFGAFLKNPGAPLTPKPPNAPRLKKPPKPIEPDISLAQAHAKEAAIGAYSYSDTFLTAGAGKGIGSTTGSLWKQLGSSG